MLCDEILEYRYISENLIKNNKQVMPSLVYCLGDIAKEIENNPRFVLSDDITWAIEQVSDSKPSALLTGLPLCRLPFPKLWFECPYNVRIKCREIMYPERDYTENPLVPRPKRLGFLMEEYHEHNVLVTLGWQHHDGNLNLAHLGIVLDLNDQIKNERTQEEIEYECKQLEEFLHKHNSPEKSWLYRWRNNPAELKASIQLEDRIFPKISPYTERYYDETMAMIGDNVSVKKRMLSLMNFDIAGEWRFVIAALMLINSKNCIVRESVDRSALSKSRVKKGKTPVLNFDEIKLRLTRVQYNRMSHSGMSRDEMRAHLVRGHFKIRKTGVFWWSSHVRGIGDTKPPTYTVHK